MYEDFDLLCQTWTVATGDYTDPVKYCADDWMKYGEDDTVYLNDSDDEFENGITFPFTKHGVIRANGGNDLIDGNEDHEEHRGDS